MGKTCFRELLSGAPDESLSDTEADEFPEEISPEMSIEEALPEQYLTGPVRRQVEDYMRTNRRRRGIFTTSDGLFAISTNEDGSMEIKKVSPIVLNSTKLCMKFETAQVLWKFFKKMQQSLRRQK